MLKQDLTFVREYPIYGMTTTALTHALSVTTFLARGNPFFPGLSPEPMTGKLG
jgi:hypothetical protein